MFPICSQIFLALLLFAGVASAQPRKFSIPFRTVNGLILLDGVTVNDKPAVFLLDTGSSGTIASSSLFSLSQLSDALKQESSGVGALGYAKHIRADVKIGEARFSLLVSVTSLEDASKHIGTKIDGIFGEDVLRTFHVLKIDYKARVIELEE